MSVNDPFYPPNSLNANINNQIATLGTGLGANGFTGAYDPGSAYCPGVPGCLITYELEVLPSGRYQVSLISDTTWFFPNNITSTAQVTILAPTGGFEVINLTNLLPGVEFLDNVRVDHPVENPDFDYISFGLQSLGTQGIPYQQGLKVPLFTFENGGECTGPTIFLMEDSTDPFSPPNSVSSNAGQQLTTAGSSPDAMICIRQPALAPCLTDMPNQLNAINDAFGGYVNVAITGNVVNNDQNPAGLMLTVNSTPVQAPAHGTLMLNANGSFSYQPQLDYTGLDQFQYIVCDNGVPAICDVATVTLTILPPFIAVNDGFTTSMNQSVNGQVLPNDSNPAGISPTVSLVIGSGPSNGMLTLNPNGSFTYTPNPGFVGNEVFQYQSCENIQYEWCDTATVTITVTSAVLALDDNYATLPGQPILDNVLDNDNLPGAGAVVVSLLPNTGPSHGVLSLLPNGNFTYTPNANYLGTDVFQYVVCETNTISSCDTALVTITVTPGLVAISDQYSTPAGLSLTMNFMENDIVPSGNIASIFILPSHPPTHGDIELNPDFTFTYTPDPGYFGTEIFEYVICNSAQPVQCDTATVTIVVQPSLTANDDTVPIISSGTATGNVLDNDINPSGNVLIVSLLPNSGPTNGDLTLNPSGGFVYTPDPGFSGMDVFQYIVCDVANNDCDTAKVTLMVSPDLVANDDFYNMLVDSDCGGQVLDNDLVPFGANVEVDLIPGSGPQHGSVAVQPNGQFLYQPDSSFVGTDFFDYQVCFVNMPTICDTARVYVTTYSFAPPTPTTSCPTTACTGEDITLTVLQNYVGNSVTYQWVNVNGQIIGSGQSLTLAASNQYAIAPFRVKVTVDGHVTGYSVPCDVEIGQAPQAQASNTGSVCPGGSVQLFAAGGNGYHYEWRRLGQAGIVSTQQNPLITNVLQNSTYELTVTSEACGLTATATTTVTVNQGASIAGIGGGGTYCHGSEVTLTATNSSPGSGIVQYTWTGPAGFYFTSSAPAAGPFPLTLATLVPENEGAYTLSLLTAQGCQSQAQSVIVDYVPVPAAPQLSVSSPLVCQGESLTLNASIASGNQVSYTWYFIGANGAAQTLQTSPFPTLQLNNLTASQTGSYYLQTTVDGCTSELSNLQAVTVATANMTIAAANNTTANAPICEGSGVQLSVPILPGAVYHWYGPGGFYSNQPNPFIADATEDDAGDYLVVVQLPGCNTAVAASTEVFVNPMPATPLLLNNGPACEGSDLTLTVANAGAGVTYQFYNEATFQMVDSTSSNFTMLTGISTAEAGQYFVVASQNGCISPASNMSMVEVDDMPGNVADAGSSEVVCEATTEYLLAATPPSNGTGYWVSPSGATIINPDLPSTMAEGLSMGENLFVWSLTEGACQSFSTDTIIVTVVDVPAESAFAGADVQLCGAEEIQLNALPVSIAEGAWTQPLAQAAAGVTILDPSSPNPTVTGLTPGQSYRFTWALSAGACQGFSSDDVVFAISESPDNQAIVARERVSICNENSVELVALAPASGLGQWSSLGGATIANPFSASTTATSFSDGENVFVWSLSAPNCPNYSADTLTVVNPTLALADDLFFVEANDSLTGVSITGNDVLWHLDGWDLTIVVKPQSGTVTVLADGEIKYVPYRNAFGEDEMTYMICSEECPDVCEMATVRFDIGQSNIEPSDCFVPNTITPNGDGENDVLQVPCTVSYPGSGLLIFNRWGEVIYEVEDYQNDWGGTYDGSDVPVGTYFYLLKLNDADRTVLLGYVVVKR